MKRFLSHSCALLFIFGIFALSFHFGYAQDAGGDSKNAGIMATVGGWLMKPTLLTLHLILEVLNLAASTLLYMVGSVMDMAIKLSLQTVWYTSEAPKAVIQLGWGIVRDFFNLTFIFILLYNGIKIIIDKGGGEAGAKKIAGEVLLAALLINFSLFFTQLIIDGSNMLASGLLNSIGAINAKAGTQSISATINTMFAIQSWNNLTAESFGGFNAVVNALLRLGFTGYAIYVFFSVTTLFIGRFVAFFLLMITSPVWIAGKLIGRLAQYEKKFEETLFDQALLAPIFLFFLYIIMRVITSDFFFDIGKSGSSTGATGTFTTGQFLLFAILAGLLKAAKDQATQLSGEIGKTVSGFVQQGVGIAAGVATGGAALVGRQAVGRVASMAANSKGVNALADQTGWKGRFGKTLLQTSKVAANSSFDLRANSVIQAGAGKAKIKIGTGGGEGGYDKYVETKAKEKEAKADALGYNKGAVATQENIILQNDPDLKKRTEAYEATQRNVVEMEKKSGDEKALREAAVKQAQEKITKAKAEQERLAKLTGPQDPVVFAAADAKAKSDLATAENELRVASTAPTADITKNAKDARDKAEKEMKDFESVTKAAKAEVVRLKTVRQEQYAAPHEYPRQMDALDEEIKKAIKEMKELEAELDRAEEKATTSGTKEDKEVADKIENKYIAAGQRVIQTQKTKTKREEDIKKTESTLEIAKASGNKVEIKKAQEAYNTARGTMTGSSILDRVMRGGYSSSADKIASARIMLKTIDKQIEDKEKKIRDDIKPDIKYLERRAQDRQAQGKTLTPEEETELVKLKTDREKTEKDINDLKLQKNQLENIK